MKKLAAIAILTVLLVPLVGLAQPPANQTFLGGCTLTHDLTGFRASNGDPCPAAGPTTDGICCSLELISRTGDWIFAAVMILAVVFVVLGAYNFVTAAGDPTKITTAKNFLLFALIGFAVAFLARGMIAFIQGLISR